MSKKKKGNRWFSKIVSFSHEEKQAKSLFPNTVAQHEKKLSEINKEAPIEYLTEDDYNDYGYSSYNWDLDRKLMDNNKKGNNQETYKYAQQNFGNYYNNYNSGGGWRGYSYYQQPQLSYKYVQQMANGLAAQHRIKVEIGNEWRVDLKNKTLTYNPASLIYGTKGELLATLMHEIGKLRYCTHYSELKNKYITMYGLPALEVLSIYEDVRTDYLMLKSYESAGEVYESVIPTIEKQVKNYTEKGRQFKLHISSITDQLYRSVREKYTNDDDPRLKDELLMIFGNSSAQEVQQTVNELSYKISSDGTIFDYCGEMVALMYDLDEEHRTQFDNITKKIEQTIDTIEPSKKKNSSQELLDYLDEKTFPFIEDLFRDFNEKSQELEKAFPNMPEETKKKITQIANQQMSNSQNSDGTRGRMVNVGEDKETKTRNSGTSNNNVPPEWTKGDYRPIKDSVLAEIKQLVNKLTYLRREELIVKYQSDQKRGKLNSRKLYKSATGSRRLFKNKLPNVDTVQSFAFSVLMDISGSMGGDRIVHTTRAITIFSEVFKKMGIPFELVTFNDGATVIKSFDQEVDKNIEKKIGGLVNAASGCTNLHNGLDKLKIHTRQEKNKVVIVLSDGGVGSTQYYDENYFIPWEKKGIKSVGFGLECESSMADLCQRNSKVLKNASTLPNEFSNLLKQLIKRK